MKKTTKRKKFVSPKHFPLVGVLVLIIILETAAIITLLARPEYSEGFAASPRGVSQNTAYCQRSSPTFNNTSSNTINSSPTITPGSSGNINLSVQNNDYTRNNYGNATDPCASPEPLVLSISGSLPSGVSVDFSPSTVRVPAIGSPTCGTQGCNGSQASGSSVMKISVACGTSTGQKEMYIQVKNQNSGQTSAAKVRFNVSGSGSCASASPTVSFSGNRYVSTTVSPYRFSGTYSNATRVSIVSYCEPSPVYSCPNLLNMATKTATLNNGAWEADVTLGSGYNKVQVSAQSSSGQSSRLESVFIDYRQPIRRDTGGRTVQ